MAGRCTLVSSFIVNRAFEMLGSKEALEEPNIQTATVIKTETGTCSGIFRFEVSEVYLLLFLFNYLLSQEFTPIRE